MPAPSFSPIAWSDFQAMDVATQNVLARHFLKAGDWPRLEAAASEKALLTPPRSLGLSPELDLDLAAQCLMAAPIESFPRWIELAQKAASGPGGIQPSSWASGNGTDFGPLFAFWCLSAARLAFKGEDPADMTARAQALAESSLPCSAYLANTVNRATYGVHALGSRVFPEPDQAPVLRSSEWLPDRAALLLAHAGHPGPLRAMLRRPERQKALAAYFANENSSRALDPVNGLALVQTTPFWRDHAPLAVEIIHAAREACGGALPAVPLTLARGCWGAVCADPDAPAFAAAREAFGDEVFAMWAPAGPQDALAQAGSFAERDPSLLGAFSKLCFQLADPLSPMNRQTRLGLLHSAMFDKRAALAQAAARAVRERFPEVENPHAEAAENLNNLPVHLSRVAACADPGLAVLGWDGVDVHAVLAHPAGRVGLDPSAAMLVAKHSDPAVFGSFLDWLAQRGGPDALLAQAQAKAWVEPAGCARKKGDLLAFCVAVGKADHARELLARLPWLDAKSARDVAKAVAASSTTEAGSKALSAWEQLLLGGDVGAKPRKSALAEEAPPEPPRRAARL